MEKTEIDSLLNKITKEVESVRTHVSDAKYNLAIGNYTKAMEHLKEAHTTSNCSYCQNRIEEIKFDIEHNKNICNINSKSCETDKEQIIQKMDAFYNKLPDIESIRKSKTNPMQVDIIAEMIKSYDTMGKALGEMIVNMFRM